MSTRLPLVSGVPRIRDISCVFLELHHQRRLPAGCRVHDMFRCRPLLSAGKILCHCVKLENGFADHRSLHHHSGQEKMVHISLFGERPLLFFSSSFFFFNSIAKRTRVVHLYVHRCFGKTILKCVGLCTVYLLHFDL